MTDLVVRKIPWNFDEPVPFLWQPANPNFSIFCNLFTFIAVPFERYIITALRGAAARLEEDPAVATEAEAFLRQEAQHAAAHRKHMAALINRYPALEQCYESSTNAFDVLVEQHPVEYHAAYVANLEATFTPLFKVILDNRQSLFCGGDARVGSLMAWHFVEEIEHRSSGLILCRHLTESPWYRVKLIRETFRHIGSVAEAVTEAFDKIIPLEDRQVSARETLGSGFASREFLKRLQPWRRTAADGPPAIFEQVPTKALAKMAWRLALSQTPYHDPADQPLPDWADTWMREYDSGKDMTKFIETATSSSVH